MINDKLVSLLSSTALTLFRKNFFGIYNGAISSKTSNNSFVINTQEAIFDRLEKSQLCSLNMNEYDYSWDLASKEAHVHNAVYTQIHEAKYIACGMPPYTMAYSLKYASIEFEDYFGKTVLGNIDVYDIGDFETWGERNKIEVIKMFKESKNHIIIIKGVGVYIYDRDINELMKKAAILENGCRLLVLKKNIQ